MVDNPLRIWGQVEKTDPLYVKSVSKGRFKFSAIDAHSRVLAMTKTFGPIGVGWGYDYEFHYPPNETVVAQISLWYIDPNSGEPSERVHHVGTAPLTRHDGKTDDEAHKKAITDGLTKTMSLLGVSADVFLGKFDDNKYVAERTKEAEKDRVKGEKDLAAQTFAEGFLSEVQALDTNAECVALIEQKAKVLDRLEKGFPDIYTRLMYDVDQHRMACSDYENVGEQQATAA